MPGVANARACDWNRPAIDRMANLNLEAGDSTAHRDHLAGTIAAENGGRFGSVEQAAGAYLGVDRVDPGGTNANLDVAVGGHDEAGACRGNRVQHGNPV